MSILIGIGRAVFNVGSKAYGVTKPLMSRDVLLFACEVCAQIVPLLLVPCLEPILQPIVLHGFKNNWHYIWHISTDFIVYVGKYATPYHHEAYLFLDALGFVSR